MDEILGTFEMIFKVAVFHLSQKDPRLGEIELSMDILSKVFDTSKTILIKSGAECRQMFKPHFVGFLSVWTFPLHTSTLKTTSANYEGKN